MALSSLGYLFMLCLIVKSLDVELIRDLLMLSSLVGLLLLSALEFIMMLSSL